MWEFTELLAIIAFSITVGLAIGLYRSTQTVLATTAIVFAAIVVMQLGSGQWWAGYGYFSFAFFVRVMLPTLLFAWIGWLMPRLVKELEEFGRNLRS